MTRQRERAAISKGLFMILLAMLVSLSAVAAPLSAADAARQAQQRFGGQVLDIREVRSNDGRAYRIKLLQPSGRVKVLIMDASGRALSPSGQRDKGRKDRRN